MATSTLAQAEGKTLSPAIELKEVTPNALHGVGHVEVAGTFVRRHV